MVIQHTAGMARILRGRDSLVRSHEVRGRERAGKRSIVVISHDVFNERSGTVIALAITIRPQCAGFPLTLEPDSRKPPRHSWVKIGQVRVLSVERIGELIDTVSAAGLAKALVVYQRLKKRASTSPSRSAGGSIVPGISFLHSKFSGVVTMMSFATRMS